MIIIFPKITIAMLLNQLGKKTKFVFPPHIGEYTYVKNFRLYKTWPFAVGLYQNRKGQQVVAKIWTGLYQDLHYYELKHEIAVYKSLSAALKRTHKHSLGKVPRVFIPDFISQIQSQHQLTLLTQRVHGKPLSSYWHKNYQITTYLRCLQYLNTISYRLTRYEKKQISQKSGIYFVLLYPVLLTITIFKYPAHLKELLFGLVVFIRGVPSLLTYKNRSFVHGDLHLKNILTSQNKLYIIDVEQAMLTYPIYEVITTLASRRNSPQFQKLLIAEIINKTRKDRSIVALIRALSIFCATYNLIGKISKLNEKVYLKLLRFGTVFDADAAHNNFDQIFHILLA